MAENTEIAWTDNTFNPWWGCTKVAAGCDNCYASALDKRTGGDHWGKGTQPRTMSQQNWNKPIKWNAHSDTNSPTKVFCGSMCDWADKNAPEGERERLFGLIAKTPNLAWQLLTKRAPNIEKYLPSDWGEGYDNVWIGVTVENKREGLKRIEHLRKIPAKIRFLSIEPLLEDLGDIDLTDIHWVIVGGESGNGCRPIKREWIVDIQKQCAEQKVPFFFKQWGGRTNKNRCELDGVEFKEYPITDRPG
jgi:protein gp37